MIWEREREREKERERERVLFLYYHLILKIGRIHYWLLHLQMDRQKWCCSYDKIMQIIIPLIWWQFIYSNNTVVMYVCIHCTCTCICIHVNCINVILSSNSIYYFDWYSKIHRHYFISISKYDILYHVLYHVIWCNNSTNNWPNSQI